MYAVRIIPDVNGKTDLHLGDAIYNDDGTYIGPFWCESEYDRRKENGMLPDESNDPDTYIRQFFDDNAQYFKGKSKKDIAKFRQMFFKGASWAMDLWKKVRYN